MDPADSRVESRAQSICVAVWGARTGVKKSYTFNLTTSNHKIIRLDIRHDHPLAGAQSHATGAAGINSHPPPERGGRRVESLPRQEPQFTPVRSEHLHARHIR